VTATAVGTCTYTLNAVSGTVSTSPNPTATITVNP
jgi:hypothetical protein